MKNTIIISKSGILINNKKINHFYLENLDNELVINLIIDTDNQKYLSNFFNKYKNLLNYYNDEYLFEIIVNHYNLKTIMSEIKYENYINLPLFLNIIDIPKTSILSLRFKILELFKFTKNKKYVIIKEKS